MLQPNHDELLKKTAEDLHRVMELSFRGTISRESRRRPDLTASMCIIFWSVLRGLRMMRSQSSSCSGIRHRALSIRRRKRGTSDDKKMCPVCSLPVNAEKLPSALQKGYQEAIYAECRLLPE